MIGAGTSGVEITFFPSKLTITQPELGGDNADLYLVVRCDGHIFRVGHHQNKNVHDTTSLGVPRTYHVVSANDHGDLSQPRKCVAYQAVSSISPGKLWDWKRDAQVCHAAGYLPATTGTRRFSGQDHDVVTSDITIDESDDLSPVGEQFAYQARITLTPADIDALLETSTPSWNVMQRGYVNSAGGQWKMSLVASTSNGETTAHAQCVVRDGEGGTLRANSTYVLLSNVRMTITCVANTVQVIVNGRTDTPVAKAGFGDVNPHSNGSTCWKTIADVIAVGNKPLCGTSLTVDDRFQGLIHLARVLKG